MKNEKPHRKVFSSTARMYLPKMIATNCNFIMQLTATNYDYNVGEVTNHLKVFVYPHSKASSQQPHFLEAYVFIYFFLSSIWFCYIFLLLLSAGDSADDVHLSINPHMQLEILQQSRVAATLKRTFRDYRKYQRRVSSFMRTH